MPRFYFHVEYGETSRIVNEGLELPSDYEAWVEASTACGEMIKDLDGQLKPGDAWSMTVKDDTGTDIYLLEFRTKALRP